MFSSTSPIGSVWRYGAVRESQPSGAAPGQLAATGRELAFAAPPRALPAEDVLLLSSDPTQLDPRLLQKMYSRGGPTPFWNYARQRRSEIVMRLAELAHQIKVEGDPDKELAARAISLQLGLHRFDRDVSEVNKLEHDGHGNGSLRRVKAVATLARNAIAESRTASDEAEVGRARIELDGQSVPLEPPFAEGSGLHWKRYVASRTRLTESLAALKKHKALLSSRAQTPGLAATFKDESDALVKQFDVAAHEVRLLDNEIAQRHATMARDRAREWAAVALEERARYLLAHPWAAQAAPPREPEEDGDTIRTPAQASRPEAASRTAQPEDEIDG